MQLRKEALSPWELSRVLTSALCHQSVGVWGRNEGLSVAPELASWRQKPDLEGLKGIQNKKTQRLPPLSVWTLLNTTTTTTSLHGVCALVSSHLCEVDSPKWTYKGLGGNGRGGESIWNNVSKGSSRTYRGSRQAGRADWACSSPCLLGPPLPPHITPSQP